MTFGERATFSCRAGLVLGACVALSACGIGGDPTVVVMHAATPTPIIAPATATPASPDPASGEAPPKAPATGGTVPEPAAEGTASPAIQEAAPGAVVAPVEAAPILDLSNASAPASAPQMCLTSTRIVCVDKATAVATVYESGTPGWSFPVRFGDSRGDRYKTGDGHGHIYRKSKDHVSSVYGTPMPYAMFISWDEDSRRGQAFHYSTEFEAQGYEGASHGCMNIGSEAVASRLWDSSEVGTEVYVCHSDR